MTTAAIVLAVFLGLVLIHAAAENIARVADRLGELAAVLRGLEVVERGRLELERAEARKWATVEDHAARGPGQ